MTVDARQLVADLRSCLSNPASRNTLDHILQGVRQLRHDPLASPQAPDIPSISKLAVLLEYAGHATEADRLLDDVIKACNNVYADERAELLNQKGMLSALRGQPVEAITLFEEALFTSGLRDNELKRLLQANLASAFLRQGRLDESKSWAQRALAVTEPNMPAALDVMLADILWRIARHRGDGVELKKAVKDLSGAVQRRINELDENDPDAFALVADLASAQFTVERLSGGSNPRVKSLGSFLELSAIRISAMVGARDRRTLHASIAAAMAQFDLAKDDGSSERLEHSARNLRRLHLTAAEVLSEDDPQLLTLALCVAGADLELARTQRSQKTLATAVARLRTVVSDVERVFGPDSAQTVESSANVAIGELDLARASRSEEHLRDAVGLLDAAAYRVTSVLGSAHPLNVLLPASLRLAHSLLADVDNRHGQFTTTGSTAVAVSIAEAAWGIDDEYLPAERAVAVLHSTTDPDEAALETDLEDGAVLIRVPADPDYLVVIRSAAAHTGTRLGYRLKEVADLRLAADEACVLLLRNHIRDRQVGGSGDLECRFVPEGSSIRMLFSLRTRDVIRPDDDELSWTILSSLADEITWRFENSTVHVEILKRRETVD